MTTRRALRIALLGVALCIVTGALLVAAIAAGLGRSALRSALAAVAADALGAAVEIGALEGPLYPYATLRNVRIAPGGENAHDPPAAAFARARIELDLLPALRGGPLVLRRIEVEGLHLRARRRPDGSWNLAELFPATGEPEAPDDTASRALVIDALHVSGEVDVALDYERGADASALRLLVGVQLSASRLALPFDGAAAERARGQLLLSSEVGALALRLADGTLRIEQSELSLAGGSLVVEGEADAASWIGGANGASARFDLSVRDIDLGAAAGEAWQSQLSAQAELRANRDRAATQVSLHAVLEPSELAGAHLSRGELRASARFPQDGATRGAEWQIHTLELDSELARGSLHGRGADEQLDNLDVAVQLPNLESLAPLLGAGGLRGALALEASLSGALGSPTGGLRLRGERLEIGDLKLGSLALRASRAADGVVAVEELSLRDGALPLELEGTARLEIELAAGDPGGFSVATTGLVVRSDQQSLRIAGRISSQGFDDLLVRAESLDVARLLELAGVDASSQLRGRADLDVSVSGPFARPRGIATLRAREIEQQRPANETPRIPAVALSAELRSAEQGLALTGEVRAEGVAAALFTIDARAPWPASGVAGLLSNALPTNALATNALMRAELRADNIDLALIAPFLPRAVREPQGRGDLAIDLSGSPDGVRVSGQLALREAGITVPLARQRYGPIEVQLEFDGERVRLRRFDVGEPGAHAALAGEIELRNGAAHSAKLRLELDDFPLARSPLLSTDVRGHVALQGPIQALRLSGAIELANARSMLPEEQDRELREIRVIAADSASGGALEVIERGRSPDAWQRASVDLDVRVPPSWVRGRGAELELTGELELRKEPNDVLRAVGEARAVRGGVRFQSARFELRRGVVTFDGGESIADPLIDIEATRRVRDVTVVVQLGGRASAPELIRLSGEPAMSEEEAFAYLVFGRPLAELAQSERGSVESAALSIAASMAADEFSALIGRTGLVDTLDVAIEENGRSGTLRVGKYVGERTFVRYGQTFGSVSAQDVQIEYRLTPSLSIESQMSSQGDAGADLIWHLEY
jgi:autotransporter translocation and assembly factor TamB